MRQIGRLKLSLAFLACVLGSALAAGPAAAAAPQDPLTTNIPYVSWRGEQVRLVKCDPALAVEGAKKVDWLVESWTGSPGIAPQLEPSTVKSIGPDCVAADFVTLDPGLARIKLVVSDAAGGLILKHQFLSIWLTLKDPSIHEVAKTDPTGDSTLGDPLGNGKFDAGERNGRIQVKVQGTFPGPGGTTYTLPDAWPQLAALLADDSDSNPDNNAARWDIHDDLTKFEPHVGGYCTTGVVPTTQDAVDNCNTPSTDRGPFSRVFGDFAAAPVDGPFDPLWLNTLLSDGRLNADDAPMPAARVDVTIAANKGGSDLGGVGSLEPADKSVVYSRNSAGTASAHNFYAPFYDTYIPATSRGPRSSGIDGPAAGNNFRGFLVDGLYHYWSFADVLRTAVPVPTTCLRRKDEAPVYRLTPVGPAESWPSTRTSTARPRSSTTRARARITTRSESGTPTVDATSRAFRSSVRRASPPRRGTRTRRSTIRPTRRLRWPRKCTRCSARPSPSTRRVPGEANSNSRIVVAQANDVDGKPFVHERVCFNIDSKADGAFGYSGQLTPTLFIGGTDAPGKGTADVCQYTDANGRAAVEILNSDPESDQHDCGLRPRGSAPQRGCEFRDASGDRDSDAEAPDAAAGREQRA